LLSIRKRGRVYHVRGSVRLGGETRRVKEHSTGCDRREDAEAYRARLEHELRQALLHGDGGKGQALTVADAGLLYMNRPGGLKSYDLWRLDQLNEVVGDYPVAKAAEGWGRFKQVRCGGLAPATVERFRAVLQAALNNAAAVERFDPPKVGRTDRVPRSGSGSCRGPRKPGCSAATPRTCGRSPRPYAFRDCGSGKRCGSTGPMSTGPGTACSLPRPRPAIPRSVTLHPAVRKALHRLWVGRGSPAEGRVFLNRVGRPYADPRRYKLPGGSPIRRAHQTACRRAGVDDFHVHDWRHHWACRCVMSGIDLETIRQEGGWKSLRMVEHYGTVSAAHRATAMKKLR
jgi:hypothetical protein